MSEEIKAMAASMPSTVPGEAIDCLIDMLTKKTPMDRFKAFNAAYAVIGYLTGKFFSTANAESVVKPKKMSQKQIAECLAGLKDQPADDSADPKAKAKAFPVWLLPVLFDLANKWIQNAK